MSYKKFIPLNKFKGIYNLGPTPPPSGTYFSSATNINVDRNDTITRRPGYTLKLSGYVHSMYTGSSFLLAVVDNDLCIVYPEQGYQKVVLLPDVGENYWAYETVGDRIYASNGHTVGYVEKEQWSDLPAVTDTYKRQIPPGHILSYFRGRLYIAYGRYVVYSDPAAYHMIDVREDSNFFQRPSRIRMIMPVTKGIWLSDSTTLFFLKGESPGEFTMERKAEYPAIEGTAYKMPFIMLNGKYPYYNPVLFTTPQGICMGTEDGFLFNFTDQGYQIPAATRGSSIVRRGDLNQYISIIR